LPRIVLIETLTLWSPPPKSWDHHNRSDEQKKLEEVNIGVRSSDSPFDGSTIEGGRSVFHHRLRSVIYHPLGLPLTVTQHGQNPEDLKYFSRQRRTIENDTLDSTFKETFDDYMKGGAKGEKAFTALLSSKINSQALSTGVHSETE